jgi:hypothetical protein
MVNFFFLSPRPFPPSFPGGVSLRDESGQVTKLTIQFRLAPGLRMSISSLPHTRFLLFNAQL